MKFTDREFDRVWALAAALSRGDPSTLGASFAEAAIILRTMEKSMKLPGGFPVLQTSDGPVVFARGEDGSWSGKWMDLYGKGSNRGYGNRVEENKYSTLALMKSIMEKEYLGLDELVNLYAERAEKVTDLSKLPDKPVTYIGLRRPEGLHPESTVYTLEQFKSLIPA